MIVVIKENKIVFFNFYLATFGLTQLHVILAFVSGAHGKGKGGKRCDKVGS